MGEKALENFWKELESALPPIFARHDVPKYSPRNPENTPNELEKAALDKIKAQGLTELVVRQPDAIHYFGSSSFDVEFMKPLRPESGPQSGRPW